MNSVESFCNSLPDEIKKSGGHPEAAKTSLQAGNLTMFLQNGSLRYISDGRTELVRMIYSAVRDKDWLTVEPVISGEKISRTGNGFSVVFHARYQAGDVDFAAEYRIDGYPDSTVSFEMKGEALSSFEKSRIGFCLLHPVTVCSGVECTVTHDDQTEETLRFPVMISPDQPFLDIRAMKWQAGDTVCTAEFFGDIFETEDQRNWTDASYKTYCTPLSLPCPAKVQKGDIINQKITIKAEINGISNGRKEEPVTIAVNLDQTFRMPGIGTQQPSSQRQLSGAEISLLKNIRFSHYRADIHLFEKSWREGAEAAFVDSERLAVPLELALFFSDDAASEASAFVQWALPRNAAISLIHLFHVTELATPDLLVSVVPSILSKLCPDSGISLGTNANFAELNRFRPGGSSSGFLTFSVHPQEHASDNETMVENLRGQGDCVKSAAAFSGKRRTWVSPVNIQRRFNANIEAYEQAPETTGFPPQADSRIMSLFGAGWTAGSLKVLAEAGVAGLTLFEAAGERGIMQGESGSKWPEEFRSVQGMLFPVYQLLSWLGSQDVTARLVECCSTAPLKADALLLTEGVGLKGVVVNYTPFRQKITIPVMINGAGIKRLDAETFSRACSDPHWIKKDWQRILPGINFIQAEPYSVNFLELIPGSM